MDEKQAKAVADALLTPKTMELAEKAKKKQRDEKIWQRNAERRRWVVLGGVIGLIVEFSIRPLWDLGCGWYGCGLCYCHYQADERAISRR
ncbi:MAG: hypothetical protein U5L01_13460 [Rheinheimera sp.]|nr:hypothetical protein [Rheinheimera sp.]